MEQKPAIEIPSGSTITVKLINPVNFGPVQISRFMAPAVPGMETFEQIPSLCFLLEHPSGRKLVWDLGIRKDYDNYSPKIAQYIPLAYSRIECTKSVADVLQDHEYSLDAIEAVIWRYVH